MGCCSSLNGELRTALLFGSFRALHKLMHKRCRGEQNFARVILISDNPLNRHSPRRQHFLSQQDKMLYFKHRPQVYAVPRSGLLSTVTPNAQT